MSAHGLHGPSDASPCRACRSTSLDPATERAFPGRRHVAKVVLARSRPAGLPLPLLLSGAASPACALVTSAVQALCDPWRAASSGTIPMPVSGPSQPKDRLRCTGPVDLAQTEVRRDADRTFARRQPTATSDATSLSGESNSSTTMKAAPRRPPRSASGDRSICRERVARGRDRAITL